KYIGFIEYEGEDCVLCQEGNRLLWGTFNGPIFSDYIYDYYFDTIPISDFLEVYEIKYIERRDLRLETKKLIDKYGEPNKNGRWVFKLNDIEFDNTGFVERIKDWLNKNDTNE